MKKHFLNQVEYADCIKTLSNCCKFYDNNFNNINHRWNFEPHLIKFIYFKNENARIKFTRFVRKVNGFGEVTRDYLNAKIFYYDEVAGEYIPFSTAWIQKEGDLFE